MRGLPASLCRDAGGSLFRLAPGVSAAGEAKKQEISRVIAKEMTAAQKALQAQQWQEALKNLDGSRDRSRA